MSNKTVPGGAKLHFRRFEFKYLLHKDVIDRMIPELMTYMDWDPYVYENDFYEVNSLYYDSENFKNYFEKLNGVLTRKKPRIRVYHKQVKDSDPVFFEVKKKYGDVIIKDRAALTKAQFASFIETPNAINSLSAEAGQNELMKFLYEIAKYQMRPTALVSYKRKPLVGRNNPGFRVTFDYDIEAAKPDGFNFEADYESVYDDLVVMEVKYNGDMPYWFYSIIERYKLTRGSFSKYCESVAVCYTMSERDEIDF